MKYKIVIICLLLALKGFSQQAYPDFSNQHVRYSGRIEMKDQYAILCWSGSSATVYFEGSGISAELQDERADNFYYVIIDHKNPYKLKPDSSRKTYSLAQNLTKGKHSVQLFKITEYDRGKTRFYGFLPDKGGRILGLPAAQKHKIEFYGNSITCGYGVEDVSGNDSPASIYENHYLSYAAITARHFNAEYNCIAKSGIGILVSWFPYTMPDIYNRLDPDDPSSIWDFSHFRPDLVIINLFQNDSWLIDQPEHKEFKRVFDTSPPTKEKIISAYAGFIRTIRSKYPSAHIICALGNMDATREGSPWPGYIRTAAAELHDPKVYTCFFPFKNTPGHPHINEQKTMAGQLISFIDKNIRW